MTAARSAGIGLRLAGAGAALLLTGCAASGRMEPAPQRTALPLSRPGAAWVASSHFRPGPRRVGDVDAIVIHTTEGRFDRTLTFAENQANNYRNVIRYFQRNDREVSAHFVVGPDGGITQMVAEEDICHAQTYYNARSIGIECAGWADSEDTWTPELLDSLVELVAYLAVKWRVPVERPEGDANHGPHSLDTPEGKRFNGRGIVSHGQIQPWNRTDPGPHFPWEAFLSRVRQRIDAAAGQLAE